jgi:hypothetical protein
MVANKFYFFLGNRLKRSLRNPIENNSKTLIKMKKTLLTLFILVSALNFMQAQETQETLFGNNLNFSNLGIMVEPGFQATLIAGETAGLFQFRGGLILNNKFVLGGFYGEQLNDVRPASFDLSLPASAHLDSWAAGGFLEYTLLSSKLIHFSLPLFFGVMEVEIDKEGRDFDFDESKTLFVEPKALLELNLHRFAKLNAGIGYRMMGNRIENAVGVPDPGNAFTFQVGLKMGIFSFKQLENK